MTDALHWEFIKTSYSAFAGAFCAFVFLRVAEALNAYYERRRRHCRALGRLYYLFNELMDAIHMNIYEIDQFTEIYQRGRQQKQTPICPNRPQVLPFDGSHLLDLTNADLVNQLISYQCTVKRFNGDVLSLTTMYDMFRDAMIRNKSHTDTYLKNTDMCIRKMAIMRNHLLDLSERTIRLAATVRLRLKRDRPLFLRLMTFVMRSRHERRFDAALEKEIAKVRKELEVVGASSRERIAQVDQEAGACPTGNGIEQNH